MGGRSGERDQGAASKRGKGLGRVARAPEAPGKCGGGLKVQDSGRPEPGVAVSGEGL